jgi:TetR/AcrR family transcriptional regulator, transcriptional repressor for nem operon
MTAVIKSVKGGNIGERGMRVSREKAVENRARILSAAARLFRERGIDAAGVDEVTKAAGLTHGGFYGHFDSKEALVAESIEEALTLSARRWCKLAHSVPAEDALRSLITRYLSVEHRDAPGRGCPLAALGGEIAHQSKRVRHSFTNGLTEMLKVLRELLPPGEPTASERRAIFLLAGMVGGIILARAAGDGELSSQILSAVSNELTELRPTCENASGPRPSYRRSAPGAK